MIDLILIEEAKRLTKEYAIKHNCPTSFDIETFYNASQKGSQYRFYSRNNNKSIVIDELDLNILIQRIKELIN